MKLVPSSLSAEQFVLESRRKLAAALTEAGVLRLFIELAPMIDALPEAHASRWASELLDCYDLTECGEVLQRMAEKWPDGEIAPLLAIHQRHLKKYQPPPCV